MVIRKLFIIVCSLFTLASAASVKATVNTQEVVKGNPVQLRIKAIGGSAAFPKISDINGARVTESGTSTQSSMSITMNGMRQEKSTVKKYIFIPQYDMVIPSYTVNIAGTNYKTESIAIKVVKAQVPDIQDNGELSFILKSDKQAVSLGETFVMTLYMSISDRLRGIQIADYVPPTATDFFIKEIAGQKEYQHSGYSVIEKKYMVTTKKEGNYTISPATAKLGQPDRSRQDIFGRFSTKWMPMISNTLDIEVIAQAKDTDIVGEFGIDVKLDSQSVKANKPVNLTVKIEGKGSLEDFEFPKYEIDGVTIYSDEAKVETHLVGDDLMSNYSKSFAFISEKDFVIPKRSISVYDPETKAEKVLEVQRYEVSVKSEKSAVTTPSTSVVQTKGTPLENIKKTIVEQKEVKTPTWWMLGLAFVLGALSMYVLRFLPKVFGRKEKPYKEAEALKLLYAHISEGKDVEEMVRKLYAKKNGDKSVKIDKKELREMVERFR